ncbi:MAG: hypothetical protein NTY75_02355 [Candidatus Shapirobacteria bacterium]|nr:hypothetical protein [Candidatus Shapirobacteria bacterium]
MIDETKSPENNNQSQPTELSLANLIESTGHPEIAGKVKAAEEVFNRRVSQATNGFLDGAQRIMDAVPSKALAVAILAAVEAVGFAGYGITDAFTLLSGIRDIAGGRFLEDSDRGKAYLRGGLKIVGALIPALPTFWVEPAAKAFMPIKGLDTPKK